MDTNRDPGWTSGNCCFHDGAAEGDAMMFFGGNFLYPNAVEGGIACPGPYSAERYWFFQAEAGPTATTPLSTDYFVTHAVSSESACGDDNNPAFFFKRFL